MCELWKIWLACDQFLDGRLLFWTPIHLPLLVMFWCFVQWRSLSDEFCIQISKFHTEILAIFLKNRDYLVSKLSHHTLISWELCIKGLSTEEVGSLLNTQYETLVHWIECTKFSTQCWNECPKFRKFCIEYIISQLIFLCIIFCMIKSSSCFSCEMASTTQCSKHWQTLQYRTLDGPGYEICKQCETTDWQTQIMAVVIFLIIFGVRMIISFIIKTDDSWLCESEWEKWPSKPAYLMSRIDWLELQTCYLSSSNSMPWHFNYGVEFQPKTKSCIPWQLIENLWTFDSLHIQRRLMCWYQVNL